MTLLNAIFRAGLTLRWHANPDLSHTVDRVDGHSGRVARIIFALHPDPSLALIKAALTHDDGEHITGDLPWTFKRKHPEIAAQMASVEEQARAALWGAMNLTDAEKQWLRFADRLDAYMWAAHHKPEVMTRGDWTAARAEINVMADKLGIDSPLRKDVG